MAKGPDLGSGAGQVPPTHQQQPPHSRQARDGIRD